MCAESEPKVILSLIERRTLSMDVTPSAIMQKMDVEVCNIAEE